VVLEGLGWRPHRIWATDWWLSLKAEAQKLLARLNIQLEADPRGEGVAKGSGSAVAGQCVALYKRCHRFYWRAASAASLSKYQVVDPPPGQLTFTALRTVAS
jgi:hypothetical protein